MAHTTQEVYIENLLETVVPQSNGDVCSGRIRYVGAEIVNSPVLTAVKRL
jgi:hypothetical protein